MRRTAVPMALLMCLVTLPWNAEVRAQKPASAQSTDQKDAKTTPTTKQKKRSVTESQAKTDTKPATKVRRRLPRFFGQLGLDEQQREEIYTIQFSYQAQLQKLTEQIALMKAERDRKIRDALKNEQRQKLDALSALSRERVRARKSETGTTPSSGKTGNADKQGDSAKS